MGFIGKISSLKYRLKVGFMFAKCFKSRGKFLNFNGEGGSS